MSKLAHTPGPWVVVNDSLVRGPHGESVAATRWTNYPVDPNYEANARLISLAPEMAEVVRELYELIEWLSQSGNIKLPIEPHPYGLGIIAVKQHARNVLAKLGEPTK